MTGQDLTGFVSIPRHPAYLVHRDGRVYSHKVGRIISETKSTRSVMIRVKIGQLLIRVRDLVYLVHGTTADFELRVTREAGPFDDDDGWWAS